jgi:hypothetical protein
MIMHDIAPSELMVGVVEESPSAQLRKRRALAMGPRVVDAEPLHISEAPSVTAGNKPLYSRVRKRKPDWRNMLRPRYIKLEPHRIRVVPEMLNPQTTVVLSASGGPFFSKGFTLPLSESQLSEARYLPPGKKREMRVDVATQWDMFRMFFRKAPEPGVYIIGAAIRTIAVRQVVFSMFMHATQALQAKTVQWVGLYGSYRETLRDDRPRLDALVIGNVHDGMDNVKYSKLRDLLHIYSAIPVILVVDGVDPLEFAITQLRTAPKAIVNIGSARIPSYIRHV